jgi:hypothetical protein
VVDPVDEDEELAEEVLRASSSISLSQEFLFGSKSNAARSFTDGPLGRRLLLPLSSAELRAAGGAASDSVNERLLAEFSSSAALRSWMDSRGLVSSSVVWYLGVVLSENFPLDERPQEL